MMMNGFGGYGFGMGFGSLFMVLFWAGIMYILYSLLKRSKEDLSESPEEILKKRYAKGEIAKKEFEDMKQELRN